MRGGDGRRPSRRKRNSRSYRCSQLHKMLANASSEVKVPCHAFVEDSQRPAEDFGLCFFYLVQNVHAEP